MRYILCIETAAEICSIALFSGNELICYKQVDEANAHSRYLTVLIENAFKESGMDARNLSAVAISKGPGSYTGLRIGASVAKGICYAMQIPLIAIDTLTVAAYGLSNAGLQKEDFIISLLDARRMEVYYSVFNSAFDVIQTAEPYILTGKDFLTYLDKAKVHFVGNGVSKFREICDHPNAVMHDSDPKLTAMAMQIPALNALRNKQFEDVVQFEPTYLKPVMATKPKKKWF